jgi:pyridoxal phosphate enzyme (YggS family)
MVLPQNLRFIQEQIPSSAKIIAVSKYVSASQIRQLYGYGFRHFGESRLQDTISKQKELQDLPDLVWHFIGNLQSNKLKKIVQCFPWIHSVSSEQLFKQINQYAQALPNKPKILMQVKLLPDPGKKGFAPSELVNFLEKSETISSNLELKGLMTILPKACKEANAYTAFTYLAELQAEINNAHFLKSRLSELSMGMSEDYLEAIKAGSTILRLGRKIFNDY